MNEIGSERMFWRSWKEHVVHDGVVYLIPGSLEWFRTVGREAITMC